MRRNPFLQMACVSFFLAVLYPDRMPLLAQDPPAEPSPPAEVVVEPAGASPAEPRAEPQPVESRGALTTTVGTGHLLTLPAVVERVALADETVARVQVISAREVLTTGLQPGQTTLFVWLEDGRRFRHLVQVAWDLELLESLLKRLDERIAVETSLDGDAVVLLGEVNDAETARQAKERAERLLSADPSRQVRVIDLLEHPDPDFSPDDRLAAALREVDPRITARRLQVGPDPQPERDTYILEGRVGDVATLVRALTLAERQLGGTGIGVVPVEGRQDLISNRNRGFFGNFSTGPGAIDDSSFDALSGLVRAPGGLASEISRGLVMMSQSGRVVSFLEVDELPQIMVSIRVLEIDRGKAKRVGVNFRIDTEDYSIGSFTGPQASDLPGLGGDPPGIDQISGGNLAVAFVDDLTSITAAVDFLEDRQLARAVAEPNVLTLTGEQASVVVGGEVPIPSTTLGETTAVQGFLFQEFGIRLDIRATVGKSGAIALEVASSIIRPSVALSVSDVPGFTVQSVQTTARVYSGQSLVLGGLLDFEESLEERRLPVIGAFPLFRWRRKSRSERELLFVISPRLVDIEPAEPVEKAEPIIPLDPLRLDLPDLRWPEDRDGWRDRFNPPVLSPEGVPSEFLRELESDTPEEEDEGG